MDPTSHNTKPNSGHKHHPQPSPSHLLASAKVVAQAAQSTFRHDAAGNKLDKTKVAEAAEDLLAAASHYGKLDEKSFGKYVGKAESYLHQYHSSSTNEATHTSTTGHSATAAHSSGGGGGGGSHSEEGGMGEYLKLAQGFLKTKH